MTASYLFDASSLVELLLGEVDIDAAFDQIILDLTVYEATNALWTLGVARDHLTEPELETALSVLERLEQEVQIENATGQRLTATVEVAREHGLTVYDGAYLATADRQQLTVVTEDSALREAAETQDVGVVSVNTLS